MHLKLYQIRYNQAAYGPYSATVCWVSGCSIRCKGCFNPHLFDGSLGRKKTPFQILRLVLRGKRRGDTAVVFVGGEPMDQPIPLLLAILLLRLALPQLTITIYSGYSYDALKQSRINRLIFFLTDFLIDGPFIIGRADEALGYRGSDNQRVIDLKASRESSKIVTLDWDRLIMISDATITTTPLLSDSLGLTGQIEACGNSKERI